jgi:hypothetical protein
MIDKRKVIMRDIDQILARHKVPGIEDILEKGINGALALLEGLDVHREEEKTEDGMYWINIVQEDYISGLGYAPSWELAFFLGVYDFLVSNELWEGDLIPDLVS